MFIKKLLKNANFPIMQRGATIVVINYAPTEYNQSERTKNVPIQANTIRMILNIELMIQ